MTRHCGGVPQPVHVLRNHAFIADGERGAVVTPDGDISWLCFPAWHDEPIFASLLGGSSHYVVRPMARFVWGGQYESGTLIWRDRWVIGADVVECREALAFPGHAEHARLVRRIQANTSGVPVEVELTLAPNGSRPVRLRRVDESLWAGKTGDVHVRWSTNVPVDLDDAQFATTVRTGEAPIDFVLELSTTELSAPSPDAGSILATSVDAWCTAAPRLNRGLAPRDARHAIAVLRGMTSQSGAMVAAATTSLPERADEGRDYDYRYAWIRDQCYAGVAAGVAPDAAGALLDDAVRFVHERLLTDGPDLRPAYRVDGAAVPASEPLDLPGYPGAPDVRTGNHAGEQFQLDVFGEALVLFAVAAQQDRMTGDMWRAARVAVDAIDKRWTEPDAGVWELHPDLYTQSRLACVAGLRAIASAAPLGTEAKGWIALADAIVAEVSASSVHPNGYWQRAGDDPRVDAALLLPALRGAIPAGDPRTRATLVAVRDQLVVDGYTFRYAVDEEPLGQAEGAFLLCGFWLALACAQAGDLVAAGRYFERNRAACGPSGLFSEEFDPYQRQLRGNFPQAFVHALLLEAALTLDPEAGTP